MFRRRTIRRAIVAAHVAWVPALVALGCTAAPAAPGRPVSHTPPAATSAAPTPSAQPTPSARPSPPPVFTTRPPGSRLPGDRRCAAAVTPLAETHPDNSPYNATAGSRKLPDDFFDAGSHDPRATTKIARRVSGAYTGTTPEILRWTACKWGVDERLVRAQAQVESSWRQQMMGDWTTRAEHCAPGHGLGVDGRPGQCPESWGILQVRYQYFRGAFPDAIDSTAFNADTAYAVWRACYEGYEWWLADFAAPGHKYRAGDAWGCIGRWYSGQWYDALAQRYIDCVRRLVHGRTPCD